MPNYNFSVAKCMQFELSLYSEVVLVKPNPFAAALIIFSVATILISEFMLKRYN